MHDINIGLTFDKWQTITRANCTTNDVEESVERNNCTTHARTLSSLAQSAVAIGRAVQIQRRSYDRLIIAG